MAGIYSGEVIQEEDGPSSLEKTLKWIIAASCVIAGAFLIWLAGVTPFMPFRNVAVSPVDGLSRENILLHAGIGSASSFISTDARFIEKTLAALPEIEQVRVFKRFPDRLEISLEGRKAAAMAFSYSTGDGGKTVPVYFDAEGVIFRIGSGDGRWTETAREALPVISGLVIENPYPGMRLPANFTQFLSALESIRLRVPELLAAISEIRINAKAQNGFDLIVYPVHHKVKVRLSEINEDILRYTLLMVDVLAAGENGAEFIDFRSGMASYYLGGE